VGACGHESARNRVKAVVNALQALRRRRSESEPASEQVARESGYGSPGRESSGGALQGRERHETRPRSAGDHGERRDPKDLERAASQPEPSRGARTLRTAPTRVWRSSSLTDDRKEVREGEGAPRVVVSEGARTSREADPQVPERVVSFLKGAARRTDERAEGEAQSTLERTRPQEGSSQDARLASTVRRGTPRGRRNDVGGAPEANKALLVGH
jgi:hypothetical protein